MPAIVITGQRDIAVAVRAHAGRSGRFHRKASQPGDVAWRSRPCFSAGGESGRADRGEIYHLARVWSGTPSALSSPARRVALREQQITRSRSASASVSAGSRPTAPPS
jgi:hypothetical protein